ncbi:MAG: zinc ABC transporter substrate-binding protein [Hyphomicrobiaceae bacterium]|nr:zinc ABC transporter substrate-binding protein [Hyphomicrobiaceae bacterium]
MSKIRMLARILPLACTLALPGAAAAVDSTEAVAVVATIKPVHSIAAAVMAGVGVPDLLVPGSASPHTFALKPSAARAVHRARLFVRIGPEVEPFTERLVASLPADVAIVTLTETPGLRLLPLREGAGFEPHVHGTGHGSAGHTDARTTHDGHGHAEDGRIDGHIWLDPDNARAMARHLAGVLARIYPDKASVFDANVARFEAEVEAASSEIDSALAPIRGRPFITFHDAYHYFEHRFGLSALGSLSLSPEIPTGARRISAVRATISRLGEVCVFGEPQHGASLLKAVVSGTPARLGSLDPIGGDIPQGAQHYVRMLRGVAAGLSGCLGSLKGKAG